MEQKQPILEIIRENLQNGELPASFSLPKEDADPNRVRWADGALDGVGIYHMRAPEITEDNMKLVAEAFSTLDDYAHFTEKMKEFFGAVTPIRAIDAIQHYILEHAEDLEPNQVHHLAVECLHSADTDLIKLGLIIVEIFNEPDGFLKDIIRTLGLSDEFTIFAIFNMMRWTDGNAEIFALAKKVHGWGRIHAVERLEPETQEIRDWLLAEGIRNDVTEDYSALDVYQKTDIGGMLRDSVTDMQLDQIACVLNAMLDEGPVRGISALPEQEAKEMVSGFLDQTAAHTMTLNICNLILRLLHDERFAAVSERCQAILNSYSCRRVIEQALETGHGIRCAQETGIPYEEKILAHMKADFDSGYANCNYLLTNEAYREQVLDLFRTALPLDSMAGEPTDKNGYSKEYANEHKLEYIVQGLEKYPLCGTDLVIAGLRSPIVTCRSIALRTVSEWCKAKECTLAGLSDELYRAIEQLKAAEVSENIKKRIEEYGF